MKREIIFETGSYSLIKEGNYYLAVSDMNTEYEYVCYMEKFGETTPEYLAMAHVLNFFCSLKGKNFIPKSISPYRIRKIKEWDDKHRLQKAKELVKAYLMQEFDFTEEEIERDFSGDLSDLGLSYTQTENQFGEIYDIQVSIDLPKMQLKYYVNDELMETENVSLYDLEDLDFAHMVQTYDFQTNPILYQTDLSESEKEYVRQVFREWWHGYLLDPECCLYAYATTIYGNIIATIEHDTGEKEYIKIGEMSV